MNRKILVVDDDEKILRILKLQLEHNGFCACFASDGISALETFEAEPSIPLALVDVMLPGLDGLMLCKKLKKANPNVKVIMVSAKGRSSEVIEGLNSGADDYVKKPFVFDELLARINANLRDVGKAEEDSADPDLITYADLSLNTRTFEVKRAEKELALSRTEFDLLLYLTINNNMVMSRQNLIERVWGYSDYYEGNVVEVYIKYLRDKIDKGYERKLIHTVRGRGYVVK